MQREEQDDPGAAAIRICSQCVENQAAVAS